MALGEMAKVSQEERDAAYSSCDYSPTPTNAVWGLPRVQWLVRENEAKSFKRVLDLCGNDGGTTRWLANGAHLEYLLGVDLNVPAIEGANKFKETLVFPELVEYRCQSIFDLDLEEKFDVVVCMETIEHFLEPEARKLIHVVWDNLAPGGRAFFSTPHADGKWGVTNPDPWHVFVLKPEEVATLFQEELGLSPQIHVWGDIMHWKIEKPSVD